MSKSFLRKMKAKEISFRLSECMLGLEVNIFIKLTKWLRKARVNGKLWILNTRMLSMRL